MLTKVIHLINHLCSILEATFRVLKGQFAQITKNNEAGQRAYIGLELFFHFPASQWSKTADILICHSRKSTGVANNNSDDSVT